MAKNYDYTPLEDKVSVRDMLAEAGRYYIPNRSLKSGLKIILVVMGGMLAVFSAIAVAQEEPAAILAMLAVLAAIAVFMIWDVRPRVYLRRFAEKNQFELLEYNAAANYQGLIFQVGHSKIVKNGLRSTGEDIIEIGNFQYTTGHGRNARNHSYGYMKIELQRKLPHILLDAKANNMFGMFSNLPGSFSKSQRLSLEGDFDRYFRLYAPKEYEADALYIFTPDIMQLLIDQAAKFDIEIIDNQLFLYSKSKFRLHRAMSLRQLIDLAVQLEVKFDRRTDYYADERVGDRGVNMVAGQGRRLRPGKLLGYIIIAVVLVILVAQAVLPYL